MRLRKITIDNSVKYILSTNGSPIENSHNHKPNTISNPRNQNKKLSRTNKKIVKEIITVEGFRKPK